MSLKEHKSNTENKLRNPTNNELIVNIRRYHMYFNEILISSILSSIIAYLLTLPIWVKQVGLPGKQFSTTIILTISDKNFWNVFATYLAPISYKINQYFSSIILDIYVYTRNWNLERNMFSGSIQPSST